MILSFINQMILMRDRLAPLSKEFGNPNVKSLIIRKRDENKIEYLEIKPKPIIIEEFPNREEIQNLSTVEGLTKIYNILGISRKYSEEQLRGIGVDYLINARMKFNEPVGGVSCNLVSLEIDTLTWKAVLIERISEKAFYL